MRVISMFSISDGNSQKSCQPHGILHLIDSAGVYGAERVILTLMVQQRRRPLRTVLGSLCRHGEAEKDIERAATHEELSVTRFPMARGPDLAGAVRIARYAQANRIQLIHCHGYKANILMALLPAAIRRIPHLVTLHGFPSTRRLARLYLYEWADILFAKRAAAVAVVSNAMRREPRVRLARVAPYVVHNGVPSDALLGRFSHELVDRIRAWKAQGACVLGAIGRLSEEKGYFILLRAIAMVTRAGCNLRLAVMGAGELRKELENAALALGLSGRVLFTGYILNARNYLPEIDIFVMSSLTEGFPVTLVEAMHAEKPIIATRVGGIPEALENPICGILVPPCEERPLAEAIQALVTSPDLRNTLGAAAGRRARSEFSAEKMECGYWEIYQKILTPAYYCTA